MWGVSTGFLANAGAEEWTLESNTNDIAVYTRPFEGSDINEFKGVATLNAGIEVLLALLQDVGAQTEWMERCLKSEIVEKINEFERIVYNVTDVPWPFSDRDVVVKQNVKVDKKGRLIISFSSTNSELVPVNKNRIRMKTLKGEWIFELLDRNHTKVTYSIKTNPGGSLPAFMVNYASAKIPYKTLSGMKRMVTKQKYIKAAKRIKSDHNSMAVQIIHGRVNYLLKGIIDDNALAALLQREKRIIEILFETDNNKKEDIIKYVHDHYSNDKGIWQKSN